MQQGNVFVKLNYKTIGEFKSLIIDKENPFCDDKRYMMCAGKYSKEGWTFVFKANSINEAEELIAKRENKKRLIIDNKVHIMEQDVVEIPRWM